MAAYLIGDIEVTDPAAYDEYRKMVSDPVAKYGGRFIVRGGTVVPKEGGWTPKRIVVLEFPSLERAKAFYDSPEYAAALALRLKATNSRLILVEGV